MSAATVTPCVAHRYVLESPHGSTIRGECKRCGATRTFLASPPTQYNGVKKPKDAARGVPNRAGGL